MFKEIKDKIQAFELTNDLYPYFPLSDYLHELKIAMNIDHLDKNILFCNYINNHCIQIVSDCIDECKVPVYDKKEIDWYMKTTIRKIKEKVKLSIGWFELACHHFGNDISAPAVG
jgi:hypothetical protein